MKKTFSSKKSAFSLIELSIVLIIIGLLIAGITGGASLIKSSELRSVISEARSYAVGVNAFYTQFDGMPGDFDTAVAPDVVASSATTSDTIGDGDGFIEFYTGTVSESTEAWRDLEAIGAVDITVTNLAPVTTAQAPGTQIPASKVRAAGWTFSTLNSSSVVVLTSTTVQATADTAAELNALGTASISPADALSIDSKIDDGVANAGDVRGNVITASVNADADATTCIATGTQTAYYISNSATACALSYAVDVNS